jgi:hypothetical protein
MNTNIDWLVKIPLKANNYKNIINKKIKSLEAIDLTEKSTEGNKSKQYDLFESFKNDSTLQHVVEDLKKYVFEYLASKINYKFDLNLLSAWTVIGKRGSYHTVHKHNKKLPHIATVLYLDTPKNRVNREGVFYFFINKNNNIEYHELTPKTHDFIIMPVWIYHGVYPQGSGNRQTLNVDFEIIPL